MYFPYLRGRQNELIALRELINNDKLSTHVIPIIEPVKVSPTLLSTMNAFNKMGRELVFVINPQVGTYELDSNKEKYSALVDNIQKAVDSPNIFRGLIFDNNISDNVEQLTRAGVPYSKMVSICLNSDKIDSFQLAFSENSPKYNVIPYSPAFRRVRKGGRVMIDDKFTKLPHNNDYLECTDEFFSNDYLYCYEEGYSGFSDYSIVGKEYSESGFAPYAVAIHIVYMDSNNELRIHHFVSDSNDDTSDPAHKFYEALSKLVEWNSEKGLNTLAMQTFEAMHKDETYPGLGVVKKLSIMHHIELLGDYLDGVIK